MLGWKLVGCKFQQLPQIVRVAFDFIYLLSQWEVVDSYLSPTLERGFDSS